ncbi:metallophosphoesterase [Paenibacillus alginolyticus]|uniref:Metallophosphoesterase n=1 Tax=Paenibacillus alginolyticus TaxID=59839 RepID=A0ABT4G6G4_9BACL|nr:MULTISPECIES: metallophosphoesterase [Paenibacillus]MCY9668850.1 metallophosphoesterase [Paenibacillus alginolyticus]MCY9691762.1 metallophosphoesterase [Paenibacillus alginolyticus]MEC0143272.1 metallophosphoesterase [Paenibacillus alginolyticus]NRF95436.1 metallophosphoesterase [Paenibacillus frigoriresistens]
MSRRAFIRWLLAIGAALVGLSAIFSQMVKRKFISDAQPALSSVKPEPSPSVAQSTAEPLPTGPLMSYFILSDLHISIGDALTGKKLRQALDDITHFDGPVDAIMLTGDLTDTGTEQDYKELRTIVSEYKLPPVHANMGNHDYYSIWINKANIWDQAAVPNGKSDAMSRESFKKFFGYKTLYNDFTTKGHSILLLSQEAYVQEKPEVGEGAWYSDEQLEWFKERVKSLYKPGRPLFVMTHQPLPPIGTDGGSHQLMRAIKFRDTLKPYKNVFVFCGHRHQDFQNGTPHYVQESFHYFHNASVGRTLNRAYQQEAKNKAQGIYVQVFADKVVVRGREFSNRTFLDEANWSIDLQKAQA